jgi:glutamyl-Q tRNA(Asp) synthetase
MSYITRFAPSPTGYLHKGHAFSALRAYEATKTHGGRFILRIEDIDQTRCTKVFEHAIYEDLAWLGLKREQPVIRQNEQRVHYLDVFNDLLAVIQSTRFAKRP